MEKTDLRRLFFYKKFFNKSKSDKTMIDEIETWVVENGFCVKENVVKWFIKNLKSFWNKCHRINKVFESKYEYWLNQDLYERKPAANKRPLFLNPGVRKDFDSLSDSQKRRRTEDLRQKRSKELIFAASSSLRSEGNPKAARILSEVVQNPDHVQNCLKAHEKRKNIPAEMNKDKASSIYLDCELTKEKYKRLRMNTSDVDMQGYPNYKKLARAKRDCYPENVVVNETEATVDLQSLLDHTAKRIFLSLPQNQNRDFIIYYKWGFDGSSGQSEYKQLFSEQSASDASVVITALVPIRIIDTADYSIVWKNDTPSSTRYCRPIRISLETETSESAKEEYERVQSQIGRLIPTKILEPFEVTIEHKLFITMVDGKSINVLQGNVASSRCYICKAGPTNLNNLEFAKSALQDINDESCFQYGVSPLHARIKLFEFALHVAYRLDLPKSARAKGTKLTDKQKSVMKRTKQRIQKEFMRELHLAVDMPKAGFGSSNDGNTSRIFFANIKKSAKILKFDEKILERMGVILTAINIFQDLDAEKFGIYAEETARLIIKKYSFWAMSPTVHKILLHGKEIISYNILPIGTLSEESLEHRNKEYKSYRSRFSRKMSRKDTLTDVFNRFLMTSDPWITHLRASTKMKKQKQELPLAVRSLLKNSAEIENSDSEEEI